MIRAGRPEDAEPMLALQALWPALPPWSRKHVEDELASAAARVLVWEEDGGIRAFGAARWVAPEAEVTEVVVHPERLRRGIARRLLAGLHAAAAEAGCAVVGLEVSAANEPARRLYDSIGYRVVGRRPKYYNDGSDALLMSLRLPR